MLGLNQEVSYAIVVSVSGSKVQGGTSIVVSAHQAESSGVAGDQLEQVTGGSSEEDLFVVFVMVV
jgi:hypothetical protein